MKPIANPIRIPNAGEAGSFGAVRKFDVHTGIDIYCNLHDPVTAIEDGVVVAIERFTGEHADSPWWHNTFAVLVEGVSGVMVYGEMEPQKELIVGASVKSGDHLGRVLQVLKKDKGVNPVCMLHFEIHKAGTTETVWWKHGDPMPATLLDPTRLLQQLYC